MLRQLKVDGNKQLSYPERDDRESVPDGMVYVSSTGSTGRLVVVGKLVNFNPVPTLKLKENLTFTVTVKGTEAGDHRFRVEMNADQLTSPVLEEESTKLYR